MKKRLAFILFFLAFLLCLGPIAALADEDRYLEINETNFPDPIFRQWVKDNLAEGKDYMTASEVAEVTTVLVGKEGVQSLKGIEHFTALEELWCEENQLTVLDVSKNTALVELRCENNRLTELDVSKNTALEELNCFANELTSLNVSKNRKLIDLDCSLNKLTSLDVSSNRKLIELDCSMNELTSLDVSHNTALEYLNCSDNQLIALDVGHYTALTTLSCYSNRLIALDVSYNKALESLDCSDNQLTALKVSHNPALEELDCYSNQLTALDVSHDTALEWLDCSDNKLTTLDVSHNEELVALDCSDNRMNMLDLSANATLLDVRMEQTIEGQKLTFVDGSYQYDLFILVPLANMANVTVSDDGDLDKATGKVTFENEIDEFVYQYDTGRGGMDVTVCFEEADDPAVPPTITVQPKDANVMSGEKATFTVKAAGEGTIEYQWFSRPNADGSWSIVDDADSDTYTVIGTKENNGWQFCCCVENEIGEVYSDTATLTVTYHEHTPGEPVRENVAEATCTEEGRCDEVVYCTVCKTELSRTEKPIPALGHTPGEPVKENEVAATCTEDGSYDEVTYCILCQPELSRTEKPVPALGHTPGEPVRENVVPATCTEDGSYDEVTYCIRCQLELSRTQKVEEKHHIPGEPKKENEVPATTETEGSYDEVTYCTRCGMELSREYRIIDKLPIYVTFRTQPKNANVKSGYKATFKVKVKEKHVTYQWYCRASASDPWQKIPGATKASCKVEVSKANDGWQYRCGVTNETEAFSDPATLTLKIRPPVIKTPPKSLTVVSGRKARFKVTVSGPKLTYTWFRRSNAEGEWAAVPGATKAIYEVVASKANDGSQYYCRVQNADGEVRTDVVALTVTSEAAPTIKTHPTDAKVKLGGKAKFKVKATGKNVTYQWYYRTSENGEWILMEGQTSANLTVVATEANIGWQFRCLAKNADGQVYSKAATLFKK